MDHDDISHLNEILGVVPLPPSYQRGNVAFQPSVPKHFGSVLVELETPVWILVPTTAFAAIGRGSPFQEPDLLSCGDY